MADLLRGAAARDIRDRPAVIETGRQPDLGGAGRGRRRRGSRVARRSGSSPGERVVIALPTGADLALALFAVARAGLIAVPIGPSRGDVGALRRSGGRDRRDL